MGLFDKFRKKIHKAVEEVDADTLTAGEEIEDLKSNPELKDKIVENSLDSNENLRKVFTGKNN